MPREITGGRSSVLSLESSPEEREGPHRVAKVFLLKKVDYSSERILKRLSESGGNPHFLLSLIENNFDNDLRGG